MTEIKLPVQHFSPRTPIQSSRLIESCHTHCPLHRPVFLLHLEFSDHSALQYRTAACKNAHCTQEFRYNIVYDGFSRIGKPAILSHRKFFSKKVHARQKQYILHFFYNMLQLIHESQVSVRCSYYASKQLKTFGATKLLK